MFTKPQPVTAQKVESEIAAQGFKANKQLLGFNSEVNGVVNA